MYLIDKKNVVVVQVCKDRSQIPRSSDRRSRRNFDVYAKLICYDPRKRCFSESRRAVKQNVIKRLVSEFCSLDEDLEIVLNALLTDILIKMLRSESRFLSDFSYFYIDSCYSFFVHYLYPLTKFIRDCPCLKMQCNPGFR